MKYVFFGLIMLFSSFSYAGELSENKGNCHELSNFFKNCQAGDKKCTTRNLAITEKIRVCSFVNYDLKALEKITPDLKNFNNLIIEVPITTYMGLKEIINISIMNNLRNPKNIDSLSDRDKREFYKKDKLIYRSISDKLNYVEKTTNMKLLNTHIPKLNESRIFSKDDFINVQEDVSVLMTFFDLMYTSYSSFDTTTSLIAELYPNGIEGNISYKRSGEGRYSDFECAVMDRLLNFMDDKMLEILYDRACSSVDLNTI